MKNDNKKIQQKKIIVHDIRGQICPSCLLFTLREINKQHESLKNGRVEILIKTDNRNATSTIPGATSSMGYACSVEKKEKYYEIRIMQKTKQEPSD